MSKSAKPSETPTGRPPGVVKMPTARSLMKIDIVSVMPPVMPNTVTLKVSVASARKVASVLPGRNRSARFFERITGTPRSTSTTSTVPAPIRRVNWVLPWARRVARITSATTSSAEVSTCATKS